MHFLKIELKKDSEGNWIFLCRSTNKRNLKPDDIDAVIEFFLILSISIISLPRHAEANLGPI